MVETKYKISNGKADTYSTTFEPLTAEVIQQTKEKRIEDLKLLPAAATQELIFKRVSAYNLSYQDIVTEEDLKNTKGIQI